MSALVQLADVKSHLGVDALNTGNDALLTTMITRISAAVENYLNRPGLASAARVDTFDGNGGFVQILPWYPVTAVASVVVDDVSIPAATGSTVPGWRLSNDTVVLNGYRFNDGFQNVTISYTGGYSAIPDDIQQATIEWVAFEFRRRDRIGLNSKGMAGETTSFIVDGVPDSIATKLSSHRRLFPV